MRLLNARSRKLEYFQGTEKPFYAILSHTWDKDEVSFQDISGSETLFHMKGYHKISRCCEQAIADGYEYVWIDTCCIDKTSSAELSEAINSMFQWYQDADICYAYLGDISIDPSLLMRPLSHSDLGKSKWFARGWTLQELIAPSEVIFFNSDWVEIGSKNSLRNTLSSVTGIDIKLFVDAHCNDYSIAQRMSWASKRDTTRLEDEAYCLMGIFGVNMPLLYGEGRKSFIRLQEEIMKRSDDQSLFAWTTNGLKTTGLLAPMPRAFLRSGNIERIAGDSLGQPYSITNKGIQITLPCIRPRFDDGRRWKVCLAKDSSSQRAESRQYADIDLASTQKVALLNCQISDSPGQPIAIVLEMVGNKESYVRTHHEAHLISPPPTINQIWPEETILVGFEDDFSGSPKTPEKFGRCIMRTLPSSSYGFSILEQYPPNAWIHSSFVLCLNLWEGNPAALLFQGSSEFRFVVLFQRKNGTVRADAIRVSAEETAKDASVRWKSYLKPQDRILYKLSEQRSLSVNIRRRAGHHLIDISVKEMTNEISDAATPIRTMWLKAESG